MAKHVPPSAVRSQPLITRVRSSSEARFRSIMPVLPPTSAIMPTRWVPYLFLPAHIGAYSVCLGKTMAHPDTTSFPFSYIIGEGEKTILIPGRNLVTVGLYRDINKWPKRDLRPAEHRKSIINQEWLSPFVISKATEGRRILQELCTTCGTQCQEYHYQGLTIPRS